MSSKDLKEPDSAPASRDLSSWMAVRKLEKTFDLNLRDHRPNQYLSLQDKCLQDYFNLPNVRNQLHYLGMVFALLIRKISEDGTVVDEKSYSRQQLVMDKARKVEEAEKYRSMQELDRQIEVNIRKELASERQGEFKLSVN
jgi:hypothetical protein